MIGRPLTALCTTTVNVPAPGDAASVSHLIRHCVLSMLNDSVCMFPWPDHDSRGRHAICRALASGFGADPHPEIIKAAASTSNVGRTPWSAADPLVGFCGTRASRADQGVRRTLLLRILQFLHCRSTI